MPDQVTIRDEGDPEYLDGAMMQFSVHKGKYLQGNTVAYCDTLETARLLANAMAQADNLPVIISTGDDWRKD